MGPILKPLSPAFHGYCQNVPYSTFTILHEEALLASWCPASAWAIQADGTPEVPATETMGGGMEGAELGRGRVNLPEEVGLTVAFTNESGQPDVGLWVICWQNN